MVLVLTGFQKGPVESALAWLLGSREGLGLAADVATLFDLTKRCGGEPMVKFNHKTQGIVQGITHIHAVFFEVIPSPLFLCPRIQVCFLWLHRRNGGANVDTERGTCQARVRAFACE